MDPIALLTQMIKTPSLSRNEGETAKLLFDEMHRLGFAPRRYLNNVWAVSENFDAAKPTLMLNSHHDTVKPAPGYTRDPYIPHLENGILYGLGSNDAGASAVSMIATFEQIRSKNLSFNLLLAITAEEEVTGEGGMRAFLPHLIENGINIDMALIGEPTGMQPAVAERGLVVLDCVTEGRSGHAARGEGINALYRAMDDIARIRSFHFPNESNVLGPIGMQVTQIQAGSQRNVVPDRCSWVIDVRTTDAYSNEKTVEILREAMRHTTLTPRSFRIRASVIDHDHPMVVAAESMGKKPFVSPTTSDMSQMHAFPSLKMGPGDSARSHSADEYIRIDEIAEGITEYMAYLNNLSKIYTQN